MGSAGRKTASPVPSRQRVLMVCQPTSGGVARHVADLSEGLAARGCEVTVACPMEGALFARLAVAGIPVVDLPMRREIHLLSDLRAFARTVLLCRSLRPDVIHVHSSKAGFLGRIAGRLAGVPAVVFTPHCWSFQSAEGRTRSLYVALEWFASQFCDLTVAVSHNEAQEAVSLGVVGAQRIRVIHNGLSAAELAPAAAVAPQTAFVTVGRLERQKGYSYLLEAMAELTERDPGVRLSIVGDGSLKDDLMLQAATLGLGEVVRFEGAQAHVRPYLLAAHVFVLSSLWEGLPYTVLEAMAAGLPVVCTDVGGCSELVSDGATGLVVPARDPHALALAMRTLWEDSARSRRLGAAGALRARQEFRLENTVVENERVYTECVEAKEALRARRRAAFLGRRGAIVLAVVAALCLGAIAIDQVSYRDKILPGVRVGGVDVGATSVNEAAARINALASTPITVTISPASDPIPVEGSDLSLDTAAALDEALLVGRVGPLPRRLSERWTALRGGVTVPLLAAETGVAAGAVRAAREVLDRAPVDARYEMVDGSLQVSEGLPGRETDVDGLLAEMGKAATSPNVKDRLALAPTDPVAPGVKRAEAERLLSQARQWVARPVLGSAGDIRLELTPSQVASLLVVDDGELAVSEARMGQVLSSAGLPTRSPRNASFAAKGEDVQIVDGSPGTGPDVAATALSLREALAARKDRFTVAMADKEPDVTAEDLTALGITRRLSSFKTRFRLGQDGRDANIRLAADAVRGRVLGIGETFSLNEATGPRNRSTGYQESLVFSNGKVVPGVGGGVCQVSSTLYGAALLAGLKIVERQNHSMAVNYLEPGRDATAFYPTVDLKFQNNTSGPILLWSEVKGDTLVMSAYGSSAPQDIRIKTVVRKTTAPRTRFIYDDGLPHNVREVDVTGEPGYVVTSYRLTYENGVVVKRETLSTDEYQPRDWVIRVGT